MNRLIIYIIISFLLISCKRDNPFATVSGYVFYYGIAIPVSNVRVKVNEGISFSGADGYYEIPEVRKGIYTLRADKEEFEPYNVELEFTEDLVFHNVNLVSNELTSTVSGYLYGDYSGEPRIGYKVIFLNPNGTESRLFATSDSLGYYEIKLVPERYLSFIVMNEGEEVFRDYLEVGEEDVIRDIVFPDVFEFEDSRDGKVYPALRIDSLDWMIENLAYMPFVYDHEDISPDFTRYYVFAYEGQDAEFARQDDNFRNYGVLYNWKAAANACPDGWRLPTNEEWRSLGEEVYGSWFNLQYGGYVGINGGSFEAGNYGGYWSITSCLEKSAYHWFLRSGENVFQSQCNPWRHGFSVRCVR